MLRQIWKGRVIDSREGEADGERIRRRGTAEEIPQER
jgi:transcriptional regulator NrdR family protein